MQFDRHLMQLIIKVTPTVEAAKPGTHLGGAWGDGGSQGSRNSSHYPEQQHQRGVGYLQHQTSTSSFIKSGSGCRSLHRSGNSGSGCNLKRVASRSLNSSNQSSHKLRGNHQPNPIHKKVVADSQTNSETPHQNTHATSSECKISGASATPQTVVPPPGAVQDLAEHHTNGHDDSFPVEPERSGRFDGNK